MIEPLALALISEGRLKFLKLNFGKRFSVDFASFWSTTNAERVLKPALAISLRFNRAESSDDVDDNTHTY
jgi:hypothetical protein